RPEPVEEPAVSRHCHFALPPCLLLALALCIRGSAPPATPQPFEIAKLIEDLGSDTFEERETASKKLKAAGRAAEPALTKAAQSKDTEVARRAKKILSDFRWGIYPDTPAAVVKLIRSYQSASRDEKRGLVRKLFAAGAPGARALAKIAQA